MSPFPAWLPRPLCYDEYQGDWAGFLRDAYAVFEEDFKGEPPLYEGRWVRYERSIKRDWEEGFWHISSEKNPDTGERELKIGRCETIPWVRPIIMNSHDPAVLVWPEPYGPILRPHLWLRDPGYLVVLEPFEKTEFILVTAHPVEYPHTKRGLAKRYERHLKMQAPPPGG
jgi:hypothetical protein